jgi:hypothetical protein
MMQSGYWNTGIFLFSFLENHVKIETVLKDVSVEIIRNVNLE